eukprot:gene23588-9116_t
MEDEARSQHNLHEDKSKSSVGSLLRNCSLPISARTAASTGVSPAMSPSNSLQMSQSMKLPSTDNQSSATNITPRQKPWRKAGLDMYEYRGLASDLCRSP